jgi:hypothetical protein
MNSQTARQLKCQLHGLSVMASPISALGKLIQLRNRFKRIMKRRMNFVMNLLSNTFNANTRLQSLDDVEKNVSLTNLKTGDVVQIKSRKEIKNTLSQWNQLKGCAFMEEMWKYCGTQQRVFKRVEKFLDERDYLMKKTRGIIILKDVICEGTKDFGKCDRSCFFFWREEWLEKVNCLNG